MKALDIEEAMCQLDDEIILELVSVLNSEKQNKIIHNRRVLRTTLIAAVIVSIFTAAAYAIAVNSVQFRDVTNESIAGMWNEQYITLSEANLELTFEINCNPCYEAEFKANWLPIEPQEPYSANRDGWHTYLANAGEDLNAELPYVIQLNNGEVLKNTHFYMNGKMSIVNEDEWQGWKRTEITGDYIDFQPPHITAMRTRNYLILFSEENGYMLYIASSQYGFDVLEKIAENIDVEVLNTEAKPLADPPEIGVLDLGRG